MESPERALERRISALLSSGRELYRTRPDLQAAFPDPEGSEFWVWLQTHGILESQAIRDLSVPLPSADVHQFVNADSWSYLLCGASIYLMLHRATIDAGHTIEDLGAVLDFGCGPGRALRFLLKHALTNRCVGVDVDETAIQWCRANFPFGEFHINGELPPTNLPSRAFGLVYAISVFSHLSEENHASWLQELARLVRPHGLMVLTVHGRHSMERALREDALRQLLNISKAELDRAQSVIDLNGFVFVRQPEGHLNRDLYGITFITESYVRRQWAKDFDVTSYRTADLDDWQDVVVLRRNS